MSFAPQTNFETALNLISAIDSRSPYSAGKTRSMVAIASALAHELRCDEGDIERLRWAAIYCDLGMLALPDALLYKPGHLNPTELQQVKGHVHLSLQLLADNPAPLPIADLVAAHHERYDGGGYPRGMRGYEVPLLANVLHAADTLIALASDRPHRRGFDAGAIAEIIRAERGRQFFPQVVDACETTDLASLLPGHTVPLLPTGAARQIHISGV